VIPAPFDYAAPDSLDEAVALLARNEDAKVLTGGHSLIPLLKLRLARPALVVDLRRVPGLTEIRESAEGLEIGGAATHAAIAESDLVRAAAPLIAEVAGIIGDVQVRNAGTIGGSVVHADPAADWPAALLAARAELVLQGPVGRRVVPAERFFVGLLESAAQPGEILVAVHVPRASGGAAYEKMAQSASGFALAGVAVALELDGDTIATARVGVTGVGEHAYRATGVEEALAGSAVDEDSLRHACRSAAQGVEALSDLHASAEYRQHLASVLARRAAVRAVERARA
jgi:carbon-monoxide dehydrogenase medium subunit